MEIYEIEVFSRKHGWRPYNAAPWIMKSSMQPCSPPEEVALPSSEWCWYSNWRIDKQPGLTDEDGWGYASRLSRLHRKDRRPKPEAMWSRARRRLWSRVMRREASLKALDFPKVLPGVQKGLAGVNAARLKIEEIMKTAPEAAHSEQMVNLVCSVKKNIADIVSSLDQLEKQQQAPGPPGSGPKPANNAAIIKKLRNDVAKEEAAIDKALNPGSKTTKGFLPLRKQSSMPTEPMANHNNMNLPPQPLVRGMSFSAGNSPNPNNNGWHNGGAGGNSITSPVNRSSNNNSSSTNPFGDNSVPDFTMTVTPDLTKQSAAIQIPKKQPSVKGGTSNAFNAGVFSHSNNGSAKFANNSTEPEEGSYMDRSVQELMIERKFIAVDEATVMQEIIDERSVEIEKVYKGLATVHEMFKDLSQLVEQQEEYINTIYQNVEESHTKTKEGYQHIIQADKLQREGHCIVC